jgi:SAM-dependent methyltransferase
VTFGLPRGRAGRVSLRKDVPNMDAQPLSWHYGLMARWWSEFNMKATSEEVSFFRALIAADGQPALDLACGTGRILLPLLEAGLDVDGCDLSPDMLALCAENTARAGFSPGLFQQAMHELDLPRAYRTIYICDSFGLGGWRQHDAEGLRRCHRQLAPGGTLAFNHYLPYFSTREWSYWLPEERRKLPEAWPERGTAQRRTAANGDELELATRIVDLDPIEQRETREMRLSLWREGQMVTEEQHELRMTIYFLREVLVMLAAAGFEDVEVQGGYTGLPTTPDQTVVMFVARK